MKPNQEILIKYLNEELSPAERARLEESLTRDPSLRKELENVRKKLLQDKMLMEDAYLFQKRKRGQDFINFKFLALIIVVAAAAFYLVITLTGEDNLSLFKKYYQKPTDLITSGSQQPDIILQNAMNFYRKNRYDQAADLLMQFLGKRPGYSPALFYLGASRLAMNNTIQAAKTFNEIIQEGEEEVFIESAQWYLALTQLKIEDIPATIATLESIREDPSHRYYSEALKLLEEIE